MYVQIAAQNSLVKVVVIHGSPFSAISYTCQCPPCAPRAAADFLRPPTHSSWPWRRGRRDAPMPLVPCLWRCRRRREVHVDPTLTRLFCPFRGIAVSGPVLMNSVRFSRFDEKWQSPNPQKESALTSCTTPYALLMPSRKSAGLSARLCLDLTDAEFDTISCVTDAAKSIQSNMRPLISSAATAVEEVNAEAPFLTPRRTRPSRL